MAGMLCAECRHTKSWHGGGGCKKADCICLGFASEEGVETVAGRVCKRCGAGDLVWAKGKSGVPVTTTNPGAMALKNPDGSWHECARAGKAAPVSTAAWDDDSDVEDPWTPEDSGIDPMVAGAGAETHAASVKPGGFIGWQKPELALSLTLGHHCLLVGPTSTGKSTCAVQAFTLAFPDRPVVIIDGHESLRESDLLGQMIPSEGHFKWADGVVTQALRRGAFLFVDEANRMPSRTLNILLNIIERREVVLTENGSERVEAADGFQVVMASNLGKGYSVNAFDTALLSRFKTTLHFDYLKPAEEAKLIVERTGINPVDAMFMARIAAETRKLRREKTLLRELTPRNLFAWAEKFKAMVSGSHLERMIRAADTTWMHYICGVDGDGYLDETAAQIVHSLIEAHTDTTSSSTRYGVGIDWSAR